MNEKIYNELTTLNLHPYNREEDPHTLEFHLHDTYEVYFFIAGDVTYFVENSNYPMHYGDLLITNTTEIHTPIFHSHACYERIIFHFTPYFLRYIKVPGFDPEKCFIDRPNGKFNMVSLDAHQIDLFMDIYKKISSVDQKIQGDGILLKYSSMIELAVMINQAFSENNNCRNKTGISGQLSDIMKYVDENLDKDLTLKHLSEKFYVNDTYLCTLFKKHVGNTVHQYILFKRIANAKKLLLSGHNVTEVSLLCGFNDYSNFIRTFKKITGQSPGKYKRSNNI